MEKPIQINKKGQIRDSIFVIVTLISIAMTMVVAGYLYTQIDTGLADSGLETNISAQAFDDFEIAFTTFDSSYAFIVIGLIIALLISSFFIPTHPVFIVINIIGLMILMFMGAIFSNLYSEFILQEGMSTVAYYPITTFIATKMPWIGSIIIFISTILMYAKAKTDGDGYQ